MTSPIFAMGIVLVIIGIGMRLAFGVSFEDPLAFIQLSSLTDLPIVFENSLEYFVKLTSSMFWTAGGILVVIGFFRR